MAKKDRRIYRRVIDARKRSQAFAVQPVGRQASPSGRTFLPPLSSFRSFIPQYRSSQSCLRGCFPSREVAILATVSLLSPASKEHNAISSKTSRKKNYRRRYVDPRQTDDLASFLVFPSGIFSTLSSLSLSFVSATITASILIVSSGMPFNGNHSHRSSTP